MQEMERIQALANLHRREIISMIHAAGSGHPGGSLSVIDVLTAIYETDVDFSAKERSRVVLSKGHAVPAQYAVLHRRGIVRDEEMTTFRQLDSRLQGHPCSGRLPEVDATTGLLGQGLSIGIGMAIAKNLRGDPHRVYVVCGDGEMNEGQVWEALMYAGAKRVKNLIAIFDYNHVQLSGTTEGSVALDPLPDKLKAFNWTVYETDGHDIGAVDNVLGKAYTASFDGPVAVIANTVKGKGISFMENKCEWHGKAPNDEQLKAALEELEGGAEK